MNADEIVRALRNMLPEPVDYAELVGSPVPSSYGHHFVYEDPEPYIVEEAADLIESLQAQLTEYDEIAAEYGIDGKTMLTLAKSQIRTAQNNIKLREQLAASQRRERAAVEDLEYACGSSGEFELRSICDICRRKQTDGTCPTQCEINSLAASNKWQWRGPQDEKGAEK